MEFFSFSFFIIFLSLFFFLIFNRTKIKGKVGEFNISRRLNSLNQDDYKILNDIIFQTKNGRTVQIDHIVVSVYGIFVIETKNYKGWIFGNENTENWMQVVFKEKHQFRNPIKQNYSHIYALKDLLEEFPDIRFISIVVFAGNGILKNICANSHVIYDTELLNTIKNESNEKNLSYEEVYKIVTLIKSYNVEGRTREKEHVENVHRTLTETQLKKENLICPKCNGELKLRKGKYGDFYGCSNYPSCKFTMKC